MQALQRQLRKQQQQQHEAQHAFTSGAPPHTPTHPHSHPDAEAQTSGFAAIESNSKDELTSARNSPKKGSWTGAFWRNCSVSPNAFSLPSILTCPQRAATQKTTTTNSTVILDARPRFSMTLAEGEIPGLHLSGLDKEMQMEDDQDSVQVSVG